MEGLSLDSVDSEFQMVLTAFDPNDPHLSATILDTRMATLPSKRRIGRGMLARVPAARSSLLLTTQPLPHRVIGPGVVPASLVDGLGGSPKCIRACRLDLLRKRLFGVARQTPFGPESAS